MYSPVFESLKLEGSYIGDLLVPLRLLKEKGKLNIMILVSCTSPNQEAQLRLIQYWKQKDKIDQIWRQLSWALNLQHQMSPIWFLVGTSFTQFPVGWILRLCQQMPHLNEDSLCIYLCVSIYTHVLHMHSYMYVCMYIHTFVHTYLICSSGTS